MGGVDRLRRTRIRVINRYTFNPLTADADYIRVFVFLLAH